CWAKTRFHYLDLTVAKFNAGGETTKVLTDEAFTNDFVRNVLSYFSLSPFDKLIDNTGFCQYNRLREVQKKRNIIRYGINTIRRKIFG
ncbi:MAG TPA: hypothetical protein VKQ52_14875, partial [Puia sp.]|nr:hypothetical protein [Puia sp.]